MVFLGIGCRGPLESWRYGKAAYVGRVLGERFLFCLAGVMRGSW